MDQMLVKTLRSSLLDDLLKDLANSGANGLPGY